MDAKSGPEPQSFRVLCQEHCQPSGVQKDSPGSGCLSRHDPSGDPEGLAVPLVSLGVEAGFVLGNGSETLSRPWWSRINYSPTVSSIFCDSRLLA